MYTFLIVLMILLPIILYLGLKNLFENKQNRKNSLAIKSALDRLISRNRLTISEIDTFRNKIIALDRKNNKLILVEHRNNVTWEKCLSLGELAFFPITKKVDQLTGCIQEIVIEFNFNSNEEIIDFTFYDASSDNTNELPARVRKATYWKNKIRHHLNSVKAKHTLEYVE